MKITKKIMMKTMTDIVKNHDLCVLATVSQGKPHCSLMSYIPDEEGREIYMISLQGTAKYHNLMQNPSVSLLIDTREENKGQDRNVVKALTITGEFRHAIDEPGKRDAIRSRFMNQHPHLKELLNDPGAVLFSITVQSFQLLHGVKNVLIETIS
jgi:general stress protein 26